MAATTFMKNSSSENISNNSDNFKNNSVIIAKKSIDEKL